MLKNPLANTGGKRKAGLIPRLGRFLEEMATHSSILSWKIPWSEETTGYKPQGHKESDTTEHAYITHRM